MIRFSSIQQRMVWLDICTCTCMYVHAIELTVMVNDVSQWSESNNDRSLPLLSSPLRPCTMPVQASRQPSLSSLTQSTVSQSFCGHMTDGAGVSDRGVGNKPRSHCRHYHICIFTYIHTYIIQQHSVVQALMEPFTRHSDQQINMYARSLTFSSPGSLATPMVQLLNHDCS